VVACGRAERFMLACADRTLYEHFTSSLTGPPEDPPRRTPDTPYNHHVIPPTIKLYSLGALQSDGALVLEAVPDENETTWITRDCGLFA